MNAPEGNNPFVPKQAIVPTFEFYKELAADGVMNLARTSLAQIPSIQDGAIIHDNGCGTGAATVSVITFLDASSNPQHSKDKNRSAEAIVMDSNALTFPNVTFSHSIADALLFRTIKPGGYAIANAWHNIPNMPPIEAAAKAPKPPCTPPSRQGLERWSKIVFLKSVYEQPETNVTTSEINHYANMFWSFIFGTSRAGWLGVRRAKLRQGR
ncbi:hypothetical protein DM02DRAFT_717261 [Periconia macrospinosa]|uniref:S-adenosyl-L-methionine-dependent methyltransferase n=1 Tax=Periconia macrospinosa TaxID=97972 RepID=A0A2V1DWC5_9PLEO|nr:hypothetical protein DM02DRAFT_717261 [Periconia macrospinosa]